MKIYHFATQQTFTSSKYRNTRKSCRISSELTKKTAKQLTGKYFAIQYKYLTSSFIYNFFIFDTRSRVCRDLRLGSANFVMNLLKR